MSEISVLFWTRRRTAPHGGDLVSLEHTMQALRAQNIPCDISDDPAHALEPYTLVHLYNLTDGAVALEYVARARAAQKPLVVTPIYWSHAQWFETRLRATPQERPEFFLGNLDEPDRALSRELFIQSEYFSRAAHQLVCQAAAYIFPKSRGEENLLTEEFGAAREKMRVVYNGVNPAFARGDAERFFQTYNVRDFIFSAARIEERKNTIGILRAWRDETIPLVLAGNAPDANYLELCKREASANVSFIGALTPAHIADAHAAARVHVLASWWEEVGLSALEAAVAGCNLVLTQNGPAREYFGDDVVLCDPADPRSIHDAIRAAYDAPRQTRLASGLAERFTWERAAHTLRECYLEIAAQPQNFLPRANAEAWQAAALALTKLLHLRETFSARLETRARATATWARELEANVIARNAEQERLAKFPLARWARKFLR